MWRHHGGNLYLSINGGSEVSVASGNSDLSQAIIMGWNAIRLCNMKVAEMFATSNGGQTAALAAAIANMKTHCGA
jgi:hypothetical protein